MPIIKIFNRSRLMDTLDWTKLAGDVTPETSRIPYEPNKHLFKKVAFDVFQLNSSPVESLWILEEGDDGQQFLAARYTDEESETLEVKSHWSALSDREGKNVTLTYKDAPIQRFASSDYGFSEDDIHTFQQTLVEKLGSDESFVSKLLKSQPKIKLDSLMLQFPELQALAVGLEEEGPQPELEYTDEPQGPDQDEDIWDLDVYEKRMDEYPELRLSEPIEKQVAVLLELQRRFPEELSELVRKLR
jgi:hypothetical protein